MQNVYKHREPQRRRNKEIHQETEIEMRGCCDEEKGIRRLRNIEEVQFRFDLSTRTNEKRTIGRTSEKIVQVCELFSREGFLISLPTVLVSTLEIGESCANGSRERWRGGSVFRHGFNHDIGNERRDFVRESFDEGADTENGRVCDLEAMGIS